MAYLQSCRRDVTQPFRLTDENNELIGRVLIKQTFRCHIFGQLATQPEPKAASMLP